MVKNLPAMQETQETRVWPLSWEDPLEKGMAAHSSILAWRISRRVASWAIVHGITNSRTRLSSWHFCFFSWMWVKKKKKDGISKADNLLIQDFQWTSDNTDSLHLLILRFSLYVTINKRPQLPTSLSWCGYKASSTWWSEEPIRWCCCKFSPQVLWRNSPRPMPLESCLCVQNPGRRKLCRGY